MLRAGFGIALALGLLVGVAPAGEPQSLASLSWLAGSWGGTQDGMETEEHWTAPAGGLLLGMHRDTKGGRAVGFEFLRIEEHGTTITYVAQPSGQPPTRFPLTELTERRVVFENLQHDFPQRILYWQPRPGTLAARVEGTVGGKLEAMEWTWTARTLAPGVPAAGSAK
jgi:hypothetical protein